jgi:multidrug efflux pump subunit AcrB
MVRFYERTLDIALSHRRITLLVFLATVGVTAVLYIAVPKGFFPEQDTGALMAMTEAAQDISFQSMTALQQEVDQIVMADPAVDSITSMAGVGGSQTANIGRMFITLKPWSQRKDPVTEVMSRLNSRMAGVKGIRLFLQPVQDVRVGAMMSRTEYQYTLQDTRQGELNIWAPRILARLRGLPELADVTTDQQIAGSTETLAIDRGQAARFGVQPADIDNVLYDAFGQRQVAQYFTGNKAYWVILEALPHQQGARATVEKLYVRSASGQAVPLSTLMHATTELVQPIAVNHVNQLPAVTISFNLRGQASLGAAVNAIQRAEAELGVPETLRRSFQGTAQAFQTSLGTEPYLIAAALVAVYIILGVLYESYLLPLTILSTLPSAGVGALLALMMCGYQFSLIALIGIILLIGIVKKNGIMMVDFAITAERRDGLTPEVAIRQACLLRFRPIMMTTMAAMLTGLPLILENGAGAELRQPLGLAMVGGLVLSQVLTLYTTPVVYLYLAHLQHRLAPAATRLPRLAKLLEPSSGALDGVPRM